MSNSDARLSLPRLFLKTLLHRKTNNVEQTLHQQSIAPSRPQADDHNGWRDYWKKLGQPWRTESEIDPERQQFLKQRRVIVPDIAKGIYPFKDVKLGRADVEWLLATHDSGRGPVNWSDESQREREGLDLRGANLCGAELHHLPLSGLRGGLSKEDSVINLDDPHDFERKRQQGMKAAILLEETNLFAAHLEGADLFMAQIERANLRGAYLENTRLSMAQMKGAFLSGAKLKRASLAAAHLEESSFFMASLEEADLSSACLENANFFGANLKESFMIRAELIELTLEEYN